MMKLIINLKIKIQLGKKIMIDIFLEILKWTGKKIKEPSSTAALVGGLGLIGVNNPELLANGITQIIGGAVVIYSVFKSEEK